VRSSGVVRRLLRRRGISIGRYPHTGSIDDHLSEVFSHFNVQCVFDVGANDGGYATRLRRDVGYAGQIVSFEPGSLAYARLCESASTDRSWYSYNLALGDIDGSAELTLNGFDKLNSLHAATDYGRDVWGVQPEESARREAVHVWRLDSFLAGHRKPVLRAPRFLKTDTQGHDLSVLRGAYEASADLVGIQMELPLQHLYKDTLSIVDAFSLIADLGFVISGLFPVDRDAELRLAEVDLIAIRP